MCARSRAVPDTYADMYSSQRSGSRGLHHCSLVGRAQEEARGYWRPDTRYTQDPNTAHMGYPQPPRPFDYRDAAPTSGFEGYSDEHEEYYEDEGV